MFQKQSMRFVPSPRRLLALGACLFSALPTSAAPPTTNTPAAGDPLSAPRAYDLKALALLQRAADRLKAAQSLSGQVEVVYSFPATSRTPATKQRMVKTLRLQKPNFVYNKVVTQKQGPEGKWTVLPTTIYLSDGKRGGQFHPATKLYRVLPVAKGPLVEDYDLDFREFFEPALSDAHLVRNDKASGLLVSLTLAPDAVWGGVPCFVVERKKRLSTDAQEYPASGTNHGTTALVVKTYIGKKDGIIRGSHMEWPSQSGTVESSDRVATNVVVDDKIPASTFALDLTGYNKKR